MTREYHYVTSNTIPALQSRKTAQGIIIEPRNNLDQWGILAVAACILVSIVVIFLDTARHTLTKQPDSIVAFIITLIFIYCFVLFLVWQVIRLCSFGRPALILSQWPISLGDTVRVRFQCRLRGVRARQVQAHISCSEWVSYHQEVKNTRSPGTSVILRTEANPCWSQHLPNITQASGTRHIDAEWEITIPPDLPPSFVSPSGRIEWRLKIAVPNNTFEPAISEFLLYVKPEVAS